MSFLNRLSVLGGTGDQESLHCSVENHRFVLTDLVR